MDDKIEFSIPIEPDEDGMVGRECPQTDCEKYFKIKSGTGIKDNPSMLCPYCCYEGTPNQFFTKEQVAYAESIVHREVMGMLDKEFKKLERHSFKSPFFSMSIKVKSTPSPIKHYVEKELQENLTCNNCGCEYAIYGIFAICPDCGNHNIFQIFSRNLILIKKQLMLEDELKTRFGESNQNDIDELMTDIREKITEDSCENTVTVFETFCKEAYRLSEDRATDPHFQLRGNPFQSLDRTKDIFSSQFNVDIFKNLAGNKIDELYLLFNKRHILTHNLGIIDQKFLQNTGLQQSILNHKVEISKQEILDAINSLEIISETIKTNLF